MRTFNDYIGLGFAFGAKAVHGCGCGKKAARPANRATAVARTTASTSRTQNARTYQSGTMRAAPTGPVTTNGRKTV